MASTTLALKDPKAENETRIFCLLTDGRKVRIKIYTDISVKPRHWSSKNKTVLSANPNAASLNKQLTTFKDRVLNIYNDAVLNGLIPTKEYIKDELKPKTEAVSKNKTFWNVWDYYLDAKRSNFKPKSFEKFGTLKNHLLDFEKSEKPSLDLDTITGNTLERLQNYFFDVKKFRTGTSSKYIEIFKMFLNWSNDQQYTKNTTYKSFKPLKQPRALKVVFTPQEIAQIEKLELSNSYLYNARELLILSILTGLRYSDYSRISKEHIKVNMKGEKSLTIRQSKTNDYVDIPLTKRAEEIIQKLFDGKIHAISNQKLNSYVKKVCKAAEIEEYVEIHEDRGKKTVIKKVPKYELISTHTGRRTFCTNLLLRGVPHEVVMKYSGHKDYNSFKNYVNIPKQTEDDIVRKALIG